MQPTVTQAIKNFLSAKTHADLADLYNHSMEVQVNVAQDNGQRIEGEYLGKKWHGWSDGLTTWKSIRIPHKANSDPEYTDKPIRFDLEQHAEGIGMTGWDWQTKVSRWVGYDFDSIANHQDGLTPEEMNEILEKTRDIEWVTVRRSTSGKGYHLYVFLEEVDTANHNEHAALGRAILGMMSAIAGYDLQAKVDACGGNMWVWHRKMIGTPGLELVKQGTTLKKPPKNWRDHLDVITSKRRKNLPQQISDTGKGDFFEELTGQRQKIPLDDGHKALIEFLREKDALWWWDNDHHMLVTHTWWLQMAHETLGLKGFFKTNTPGSELNEQNCFCFPLRRGAWNIRRFTPGVQEHESWTQDKAGWTRCYLNREPDLKTVAQAFGAVEDPKGGFIFREASVATEALKYLNVFPQIDNILHGRETVVKEHKDGRIVVEVERNAHDSPSEMQGWLARGNKPWTKIFDASASGPAEPEVANYDDVVRHLVTTQSEDAGWVINVNSRWQDEPLSHVRVALSSLGYNSKEVTSILGSSVFKCWRLVNKPFQPEYPGDREWNRNAAQLRFTPTRGKDREELSYPTWLRILDHCGRGLNESVKADPWCQANGITTGSDYLKCWIASIFQAPDQPLPYLFFFGNQDSGKSIFHEALSLLLTKGYKRADVAIQSQGNFNAELEGQVVCTIEEIDLKGNRTAYNKIKDWVTSLDLLIHPKGGTPYHVKNTTHWIQCANQFTYCPVFPGDTRITMCHVADIDPTDVIPKRKIIPMLEKEAPDFLAEIISLEIPESHSRLNVPVLSTQEKQTAAMQNKTVLEAFLDEHCEPCAGHTIKFSELYERFIDWVEPQEVNNWSKIRVGRELPPHYIKARSSKNAQYYVGNIEWVDTEDKTPRARLTTDGEFLREINA